MADPPVARRALEVGHCRGAVRTGPAQEIRATRTVGLPPAPVIHGHCADVSEPHLTITPVEEPHVKAAGCAASCSGGADGVVSRETRAAGPTVCSTRQVSCSPTTWDRGRIRLSTLRRGSGIMEGTASGERRPPSANTTRPLWLDGDESGMPVSTSHRGRGTTIPCCGPLTTAAGVLPGRRGARPTAGRPTITVRRSD
jgi:hypothetical protein